jgi:hypothetical protein
MLGLASEDDVAKGFDDLILRARRAYPEALLQGCLVAPMVEGGTEIVLGANCDPVFGPVVMVGFGGVFVEILRDVSLRVAPVGRDEALRMLRELKGFALLEGARGRPPMDIEALAQALVDLSSFAVAHAHEIVSCDINPFLVLLPTSFVSIGAAVGTGVAAPALTWIIINYSWHAAFAALAIVGFIWVAVWSFVGEEGPLSEPEAIAGGAGLGQVPYARLLTCRSAIGVLIAGFCAYWALTLAIVWLPAYLVKGAGFSPGAASWIVALPSLTQIVLSPGIGFWSQRLLARGHKSRNARGLLGGACVALAGIAMVCLPQVSTAPLQIVLVMVAFASGSVIYTLGPALIGEISPVGQRGAMLGISNAFYTLAGLLAPWIMGRIVDVGANPQEGFGTGFEFAGLLIAGGGLAAMLLIDPEADLARFDASASPKQPVLGAALTREP